MKASRHPVRGGTGVQTEPRSHKSPLPPFHHPEARVHPCFGHERRSGGAFPLHPILPCPQDWWQMRWRMGDRGQGRNQAALVTQKEQDGVPCSWEEVSQCSCLSTVLGQMRSFPAPLVGVRVNQCPLVMALGCTQKGEWGSHGERLPLRWSFGVTEGIHASADLGTL